MEKNKATQAPATTLSYLPAGTVIDDYMIEKALASGGFSCVYLARQLSDQTQVVIKEYLPRRLATRSRTSYKVVPRDEQSRNPFHRGRKLFMEEARILANLKHPSIVEVLNFFKENSTVYMVMTYDYGKSLEQFIVPDKAAHFSYDFLIRIFRPLLEGLAVIHQQGLLHLDVKPQNILLKPNGYPLLLDFGAAHHFRSPERNAQGTVYTRGYSPIEQYLKDAPLGPWSDIYATGATLRTCMDGAPPPLAKIRWETDTLEPATRVYKRYYPMSLLQAVDACLETNPINRPQTIREVQAILNPV